MTATIKIDWRVPGALLLLIAVPFIAGVVRLQELAVGAEITQDNARFFAAPLPAVLHILSANLFCVLGAFQFVSGICSRWPDWHRAAGRVLIPCGLIAALSGLWMTQFYAFDPLLQDRVLYGIRMVFGFSMAISLLVGLFAIRRRDMASHRAWLMRAYAIGIGAGTQVLTHLPWFFARWRNGCA